MLEEWGEASYSDEGKEEVAYRIQVRILLRYEDHDLKRIASSPQDSTEMKALPWLELTAE
ncbi:MAG: hypothetical protein K1Y02_10945 [Candidatus Hydrogenedentes bacterium]|nr:hypothetical protein [Candidatus Hydrogenedentota bacterium]